MAIWRAGGVTLQRLGATVYDKEFRDNDLWFNLRVDAARGIVDDATACNVGVKKMSRNTCAAASVNPDGLESA